MSKQPALGRKGFKSPLFPYPELPFINQKTQSPIADPQRFHIFRTAICFCSVLLYLTACAPLTQASATQAAPLTAPATETVLPTRPTILAPASPRAESTPTLPAPSPTTASVPTLTATPTTLEICSPLEGIRLDELVKPDLLKNPFQPPRPGMDDGHHGADFAYWSRGERNTMQGHPILSVLAGRVAGVIRNRQPYGNAIIIETSLDSIPAHRRIAFGIPTPAPTVQPAASLFCPEPALGQYDSPGRSLYLLYAHMNTPPTLSIGDLVGCGQPIGEVGTTGKSVNFHLHLEARFGPAGAVFPLMAHYENDASNQEMSAYCTWRVSGLFQMVDPVRLITSDSLQP